MICAARRLGKNRVLSVLSGLGIESEQTLHWLACDERSEHYPEWVRNNPSD